MAVSATASKKETQFLWEGKDKRGNKVRGKSLAAERGGAAGRFAAPGRCRDARQDAEQGRSAAAARSRNEDIAVFSRQLATMMAAGIPHGAGLRDHRQRP